jgi:hypothetical protein
VPAEPVFESAAGQNAAEKRILAELTRMVKNNEAHLHFNEDGVADLVTQIEGDAHKYM